MAITKPKVLRDWLSQWNFDIFHWRVYIGDVVEHAIDWAISWINYVLERAESAYNWARAAWDKADQVSRDLSALLNYEVTKLSNRISAWWYDVGERWLARKLEVQEWVKATLPSVYATLTKLSKTLGILNTAWEEFRTYTLPRLSDLSWWRSFWGGAYATISDWWQVQRPKVSEEIDIKVTPVRDEVNKQGSWLSLIKDLLNEDRPFLLALLERMLVRFW